MPPGWGVPNQAGSRTGRGGLCSRLEGAAKKCIFVPSTSWGGEGLGKGWGVSRRPGGPHLNPGEIMRTFVAGCQPSLSEGNW